MVTARRQAHVSVDLLDLSKLEVTAKEAAFTLIALNHVEACQGSDLAQVIDNLFAIAGLLPALRKLLTIHPPFPVVTPKQIRLLSQHIASCQLVIVGITQGIRDVAQHIHIFSKNDPRTKEAFFPHGLQNAQSVLGACFRDIVIVIAAARATHLDRSGPLTDEEVFESLLLREALKHPDYKTSLEQVDSPPTPFTKFSKPTSPPHLFETPYSTQQLDVIELHHPPGFRGRYGHPDYPPPRKQAGAHLNPPDSAISFEKSFEESELQRYHLRLERRYPGKASFGNWPPTLVQPNSVQDYQLRPIMPDDDNSETSLLPPPKSPIIISPIMTPSSTREGTPNVESDNDTGVGASDSTGNTARSGLVPQAISQEHKLPKSTSASSAAPTPGDPSSSHMVLRSIDTEEGRGVKDKSSVICRSNPKATTSEQTTSATEPSTTPLAMTPPFRPAKHRIDPRVNVSTSFQSTSPPNPDNAGNLEAYVLRPLCEDSYSAIEWSYKIQYLPLRNNEIETHLQTLGTAYSVIESLGDLLPEQLRLILIKVKNRQGHLLSVQRTRDVDLVTKMGTFKVQSVIFVLKTSKAAEHKLELELEPGSGSGSGSVAFRGFGNTTTKSGGLFGNRTQNLFDCFGGVDNTSRCASSVNQSATGSGAFGEGLFGPLAPPLNLEERMKKLEIDGEPCRFFDRDANGCQHYQSITFMPPYRDLSFEELRVREQRRSCNGSETQPTSAPTGRLFGSSAQPPNMTTKGISEFGKASADVNSSGFGGSGLFGDKALAASGYQPSQNDTTRTKQPVVSLFGSKPPSSSFGTNTLSVGLFSQPPTVATGEGLLRQQLAYKNGDNLPGNLRPYSSGIGLFTNRGPQCNLGPSDKPFVGSTPTSGGLFNFPCNGNDKPPQSNLFGKAQSTSCEKSFGGRSIPHPQPTSSLFSINAHTNIPTYNRPKNLFGSNYQSSHLPSDGLFGPATTKANELGNPTSSLFGSNTRDSTCLGSSLFSSANHQQAKIDGSNSAATGRFSFNRARQAGNVENTPASGDRFSFVKPNLFAITEERPPPVSGTMSTAFAGKQKIVAEPKKLNCSICSTNLTFHTKIEKELGICNVCNDKVTNSNCTVCQAKSPKSPDSDRILAPHLRDEFRSSATAFAVQATSNSDSLHSNNPSDTEAKKPMTSGTMDEGKGKRTTKGRGHGSEGGVFIEHNQVEYLRKKGNQEAQAWENGMTGMNTAEGFMIRGEL